MPPLRELREENSRLTEENTQLKLKQGLTSVYAPNEGEIQRLTADLEFERKARKHWEEKETGCS